MAIIEDISPPITPEGVDLGQPLLFAVSDAANVLRVGVAIRYYRDPNTYTIYDTENFSESYEPVSDVTGEGTTKVEFSLFEFGGWRGRILRIVAFGINGSGDKFQLDVLPT